MTNKNCMNCEYRETGVLEEPCCFCHDNNKWKPDTQTVMSTAAKRLSNMVYGTTAKDHGHVREFIGYCENDAKMTWNLFEDLRRENATKIKHVIFNDPATIVFWKDGTKTVVKATNEAYDPEKGLAMAIVKKLYGNKGNYYNKIKKWLPKPEENTEE